MTRGTCHVPRFRWKGFLLLSTAATLLGPPARAEPAAGPVDLAAWGLHCFCIEAVSTPHHVIRMDDNGRVLIAARGGITVAALRARGMRASDSQLTLLRHYGLLRREGDMVTTAIPVVGPGEMGALRDRTAAAGVQIAASVRPQVEAITRTLAAQGLGDSAYAVVFGYALDALLWDRLRVRGVLPATALSREHPYWRGAFWAIWPERKAGAGINEVHDGKARLALLWTEPVVARANAFAESATARQALAALRAGAGGPVMPPTLTRQGRPAFPIIRDMAGDPLHDQSLRIADTVAAALLDGEKGEAILATVPQATRQEALLIAAHELIWDIAASLVQRKLLSYPRALSDANQPQLTALYARITP